MFNIAAAIYPRVGMFFSTLPSTIAGQAILLVGLFVAVVMFFGILHRRLTAKNRQLLNAIDNMSQGLCMFDAQGLIVLHSQRYVDMYKLSPQIVRTGCSLHKLMQHRKDTGVFTGDIEAYTRNILESSAKAKEHIST